MSSRVSQSFWLNRDFSAAVDEVEGEVHCLSFQSAGNDQYSGLFGFEQLSEIRGALDRFIGEKTGGCKR